MSKKKKKSVKKMTFKERMQQGKRSGVLPYATSVILQRCGYHTSRVDIVCPHCGAVKKDIREPGAGTQFFCGCGRWYSYKWRQKNDSIPA